MTALGTIRYLQHHEIDYTLWNRCIENADNSLIYGYSFYLDSMCSNWDALVLDNYEAVMPLPWRRKFTISYLYQPYYVATLGVFGKNISEELTTQFLRAIPAKFQYWDLDLNEANQICSNQSISQLELRKRKNLFLELDTYETIHANYSRLVKRKLAKAREEGLLLTRNVPASKIIDYYINEYEMKNRIVPDDVYINLKTLLHQFKKECYQTYIATTPLGEVVGFYLIYIDKKYVYSILGGSTAQGKSLGAFYFLTDAAIQDFAGTQKTFRFEGSDLPGIAFFDQQFGPFPKTYLHLKRNNLPKLIRWLKD